MNDHELTSGPFEDQLAWPQGVDVRPDPLTVDWEAMSRGDVVAVLRVVEAWRSAAEYGHLYGHVWPFDEFEVRLQGGTWERAVHVDRAHVRLLRRNEVVRIEPEGYSWRHHQSFPSCSVRATNSG